MKPSPWLRPLAKPDFLEQLRADKLRADRGQTQFSVVVIRTAKKLAVAYAAVEDFLRELEPTIRETDTVGYLGDDALGLILPETSGRNATAVLDRVSRAGKGLIASVTTHTYPADLYTALSAEAENLSQPSVLTDEIPEQLSKLDLALKRGVDIVGALAGLIALSPVLALTSIAVAATSPGPVIFRQVRLGKNCRPFVIYKFRSMRIDADESRHRSYVQKLISGQLDEINNGDNTTPLYKLTDDDRITAVGRFIRNWSIDELPQLVNVLKGDMSLVGPRPPLPYEAEAYHSWHLRRILEIKPGITGLWQVEGRSKTSFDEMVRLDLKYIRTWSLLLDIKLMLKTLKVVLRRDGAR